MNMIFLMEAVADANASHSVVWKMNAMIAGERESACAISSAIPPKYLSPYLPLSGNIGSDIH